MEKIAFSKWICMFILGFGCATILHEMGHLVVGLVLRFKLKYIEIFGAKVSIEHNTRIFSIKPKINAKTCMYPIGIKYLCERLFLFYLGGLFLLCLGRLWFGN